ncbi:MAG: molybdenum cofactor guanylyltransferase [Cyanobacteria bacterium]|nr:molybdenum cofactor guanylyltransferase [Cyanobacteriota bacterium]
MPLPPRPLRPCLLSGGDSRRMGQDKALLPHPEGGTWLERQLRLLATLGEPVTLLTRHSSHLELAAELNRQGQLRIQPVPEPAPQQGPLVALQRLFELNPGCQLLLCPVDMPWLGQSSLRILLQAAAEHAEIVVAHDGARAQPLLGIYVATAQRRRDLRRVVDSGERRLQTWLAQERPHQIELPADQLRNCNHPSDWAGLGVGMPR